MSDDITPRDTVWIGILRARRQHGEEFLRSDVLSLCDASATTVAEVLRAGESHDPPVFSSRKDPDDRRRRLWSLAMDTDQRELPSESPESIEE